jgi:hypothetical protein
MTDTPKVESPFDPRGPRPTSPFGKPAGADGAASKLIDAPARPTRPTPTPWVPTSTPGGGR